MPKAERLPFITESKLETDYLMLLDWLSDWEQATPETEWREQGAEDIAGGLS